MVDIIELLVLFKNHGLYYMRKMKPSIEVLEEIQTTQSKKDERKPFTSKQTQKCIKRFLCKAGLVGVGGGQGA